MYGAFSDRLPCDHSEANHAGGYQYRLAPKSAAPLTEALFQKLPLPFVGMQGIRWAGGPQHGGSEIFFNGTYVTEGTCKRNPHHSLSNPHHSLIS